MNLMYARAMRQVLRQSAYCGFYRLRYAGAAASRHVPRNSTRVSAAWLAEQLKAADASLAQKIKRIEFEALGSQTTDRSLARLIFKPGESSPAVTCFIKSRSRDFATGLFGALFDLGLTEVRFYRQLRAEGSATHAEAAGCNRQGCRR